jgi:hypothetical protein
MHLEIFVYLLRRFLGENRIYTVQRENSFTNRALPRNWPFGLVIKNRSCKDWHGDSFPRADSGRQPCGFQTGTTTQSSQGRHCTLLERLENHFPIHLASGSYFSHSHLPEPSKRVPVETRMSFWLYTMTDAGVVWERSGREIAGDKSLTTVYLLRKNWRKPFYLSRKLYSHRPPPTATEGSHLLQGH